MGMQIRLCHFYDNGMIRKWICKVSTFNSHLGPRNYRTRQTKTGSSRQLDQIALLIGLRSIGHPVTDSLSDGLERVIQHFSPSAADLSRYLMQAKLAQFCHDSSDYLKRTGLHEVLQLQQALRALATFRRRSLSPVIAAYHRQDEEWLIYKGDEYVQRFANNPHSRCPTDLDLLVRPEALATHARLLNSLGFAQQRIEQALNPSTGSLLCQPWEGSECGAIAWNGNSPRAFSLILAAPELEIHRELLSRHTAVFSSGRPYVVSYIDIGFSVHPRIPPKLVWANRPPASGAGGVNAELLLLALAIELWERRTAHVQQSLYFMLDALRIWLHGSINEPGLWSLARAADSEAALRYGMRVLGQLLPMGKIGIADTASAQSPLLDFLEGLNTHPPLRKGKSA
ncbi:nucleotidyltransferase family protein [Pseudomonas vanderleydeniana]|uniref:Nucleotidyltransferase family protein n=1 Tax=Pseudomonas vanderleydeniana TaxID=2745495 RepID=A0A9E6PGQ2_9PSED|nr:nucleotidyltransferase family protein [Pseudomonas vanderleydeniana]QXI26090.1 nucleotidyltransferase family protein [Pseudomonas vanderleydeniana]